MTILPIVQAPDAVLRQKCLPVCVFDEELHTLVKDMLETMYHAEGIGLAAPQVGHSVQVLVMDTRTLADGSLPDSAILAAQPQQFQQVLINPVIQEINDQPKPYDEGCLSIPGYEISVERPEKILVSFQDIRGNSHLESFQGLPARCVQHEMDHLNGVLIVDYTSRIRRNRIFRSLRLQQAAHH